MRAWLIILATSVLAGCAEGADRSSAFEEPTPALPTSAPATSPMAPRDSGIGDQSRRLEGEATVDYSFYSMLCEGLHGFGTSVGEAEPVELGPPGNESRVDVTLAWKADGRFGESLRVVVLDAAGRPTEFDWIGRSPLAIAVGPAEVERGEPFLRLGLRPGSCDLPLLVGSGSFDVQYSATWS